MGNEHGILAHREANGQSTLPRLQSLNGIVGTSEFVEEEEEIPTDSPGKQASDRLHERGHVNVGDKFVVWNSSSLEEASLLEGKVVGVYDRESDAFAGAGGRRTRLKCVQLEFRMEMDMITLQQSVGRAQQAITVEREWRDKLRSLGLTPGATADLWVPSSNIIAAAEPKRRRSSLQSYLRTPARKSSSDVHRATSLADAVSPHERITTYTLDSGTKPPAHDTDDDADEFADAIDVESSLLAGADGPGDVYTYTLLRVEVRWNFQDAVVDLHVARLNEDGSRGPAERLPYTAVRDMLENAKIANETLQTQLKALKETQGICVGAKVDLWIEDSDTNVRAAVTSLGHKFNSLTSVEIKPTMKYFLDGQKYIKEFDDFASFSVAWKQAKYVTEQQLMLTQEAFERGVIVNETICIHQDPRTQRWAFKEAGALDAVVRTD